ncbi:MAG: flagellar basal body-associated FliL family protein [Spirochaetales bacterium]|nr:flagellar basal body-associated FliL family protein [Spirochaetales bacterium]
MADEQLNDNEEYMQDESSSPAGKKRKMSGLIPPIVLTIFKWLGLILLSMILIIGVSVVVNIVMNKNKVSPIPLSEEFQYSTKNYDWYSEPLKGVRTQIDDKTGSYTVMVDVQLGYEKGNKQLYTELTEKTFLIKDNIRNFISSKTKDELSNSNEQKLKAEMKSRVNQLLRNGQIDVITFDNKYVLGM